MYQWNRIKSPEINPCIYGQLIYDKGNKNTPWVKDTTFNKWCRENWIFTCKRMKMNLTLHTKYTLYTKINLKWIENLNVRPESIKLLEKRTGKKLLDVGLGTTQTKKLLHSKRNNQQK